MVTMLIAVAVFFSVATLWQYSRMAAWMTASAPPPSNVMWTDSKLEPGDFNERMMLAQRRAEYALETDVIRRRYEQNSQAITTRLWARFMGFMTGMIMAIVGSAFILGKLQDTGTEITTGGALTTSLKSASPGVVLATLGTVLIGLSLWIQVTVNVRDVPVFFGGSAHSVASVRAVSVPTMLPEVDDEGTMTQPTSQNALNQLLQTMPPPPPPSKGHQ